MNKIVLLGDLHFGARGDSEAFSEYFFQFFDEVFFPYLIKNKIKTVFQFGDIVERRKFINIKTMKSIRERFLPKFKEHNINLVLFLGNHDTYHKNTNEVNALNVLFSGYDNVRVIEEPIAIEIGKKSIDIIPWINRDNYDDTMAFVERSTSDYAFGHFEFTGFDFQVGIAAPGGMSIKPFKQYKHVWSGHYHHHSTKSNITYIGTPYEITWADYNDDKVFMVLDVDTGKTESILNVYRMFHKIKYETGSKVLGDYKNQIIKVYTNENRDAKFDDFIDTLNGMNPQNVTVIDSSAFNKDDILNEQIEVEDTLTVTLRCIEKVEDVDPVKMKKLVTEIYNEAINL